MEEVATQNRKSARAAWTATILIMVLCGMVAGIGSRADARPMIGQARPSAFQLSANGACSTFFEQLMAVPIGTGERSAAHFIAAEGKLRLRLDRRLLKLEPIARQRARFRSAVRADERAARYTVRFARLLAKLRSPSAIEQHQTVFQRRYRKLEAPLEREAKVLHIETACTDNTPP
jgi:hypothetical protein